MLTGAAQSTNGYYLNRLRSQPWAYPALTHSCKSRSITNINPALAAIF